MQFKLKYKIYKQLKYTNFEKLPLRILKFKRPCWGIIQRKYIFLIKKRRRRRRLRFQNITKFCNTLKKWSNFKRSFLNNLNLKRLYYQIFNFGLKKQFFKRYRSITNKSEYITLFSYFLIKPYFRLDILLYKLHFYPSIFQAQQDIINNKVLVNGKSTFFNSILRKGDIICFLDIKFFKDLKKRLLEKQLKKNFLSHIEVDYYSKTIILVKNISEIYLEDLFFMNSNFFDFKKFYDHVRLK